MQEDQRLKHLKINYLLADFACRSGNIPVRDFNKIVVDTIIGLLEAFDVVEPYYTDFRNAALKQWEEASKKPLLKDENSNPVDSSFAGPITSILGRKITRHPLDTSYDE